MSFIDRPVSTSPLLATFWSAAHQMPVFVKGSAYALGLSQYKQPLLLIRAFQLTMDRWYVLFSDAELAEDTVKNVVSRDNADNLTEGIERFAE